MQPKSGREATETFLQGTGDVLLTYENEALFAERNGEDVGLRTPDDDVQDREPGRGPQHHQAPGGRRRRSWTSSTRPRASAAGPRPASARSTRPWPQEFAADFPAPKKLWTIDDLGGWSKVNDELFDPEKGSVAKIYDEATG